MPHKSDTSIKSPQVIVATILLIGILLGLAVFGKKTHLEEVHYHAGFKIYVNQKLQDFSAPEYMHLNPCGEKDIHSEDSPQERAHLHEQIGDVVHVHSKKATWGDLLTTLRFTKLGQPIFYLNGQKAADLIDTIIQPYDRVLLLIGENEATSEQLDSIPTKDEIEQTEQKTESC